MYYIAKCAVNSAIVCCLYCVFAYLGGVDIQYTLCFSLSIFLFLLYIIDALADGISSQTIRHSNRYESIDKWKHYLLSGSIVLLDVSLLWSYPKLSSIVLIKITGIASFTLCYYLTLFKLKKNLLLKNLISSFIVVLGLYLVVKGAHTTSFLFHLILLWLVMWLNFEWLDALDDLSLLPRLKVYTMAFMFIFFLSGFMLREPILYAFLPIFVYYISCDTLPISHRWKENIGDTLHTLPYFTYLIYHVL